MIDTLIARIGALAKIQPDKPAVIFKNECLTYRELYKRIVTIGSQLHEMGVKKGDRVLHTALSKPETVAVYLGIQYCGGIAVHLDKNSTPANMAAIYTDAKATLMLTDKPMKEVESGLKIISQKQVYRSEMSEQEYAYIIPKEEDIAELLFTTGTTGKPKGVMLSYKAVYNILMNTIQGIGIQESEILLLPLPLNHSFALRVLRAVLYQGATVVLQNGFAFAKEVENNQTEFECTALAAVPASMEILRGQMQDVYYDVLKKFRYIEVGAGSLTLEQRKRLVQNLPNTTIYNTWGSSESGGALFLNVSEVAAHPKHVMAVGKPLPHISVRTLDENGSEFRSDEQHPGRMSIKGDMQMSGYWHRDELNAETLVDGWLLTSDMVYTDQDGFVYMLGRADDIINVGGEKVSPIEVENIAGQYEHVKECACVGVDDPEQIMGRVPVLFIVPRGEYSNDGMTRFLATQLERYKLPAHYVPLQELPRNRMGKIDRKALVELWKKNGNHSLMNPVMQAILTRRSIRKFKDEKIPKEVLDMILQAGYYAPTGNNMQTWRFSVLTDTMKIQNLKQLIQPIAQEKKVHFYGFENPACLILISNDIRNQDGCQDASCAAENIFLAAHSYGIGSVWLNPLMTLCDEPMIRERLRTYGIPDTHKVWCMAALGYPAVEGNVMTKKKDVAVYI